MPIVDGRGSGFLQKRNGRSRPEERMEGCIPGAIGLHTRIWPISHWAHGSAIALDARAVLRTRQEPLWALSNGRECLGVGAGLVSDELLRSLAGSQSERTRAGTIQSAPRWILVRPAEISSHLW